MSKHICILMLLAVSMMASASVYRDVEQGTVAVDLAAGYDAMLTNQPNLHPGTGTGVRLGVGYRYRYNGLLLHVGLEGRYSDMNHTVDVQYDTVPCPVNGLATVRINSLNQHVHIYRQAGVSVPLLIGGQARSFFVLAGIKPALHIWSTWSDEAHLTSWLDYGGMIDGTMSDQLVYPSGDRTKSTGMSWQVYTHAELGWHIVPRYTGRYGHNRTTGAFSVWAEYGILNQALPDADYSRHPLAAGVKMTILVQPRSNKDCRLCGYYGR